MRNRVRNTLNILLVLSIFGWLVPSVLNPLINFFMGSPSEGLMNFSTYSLMSVLAIVVLNSVMSENKFSDTIKGLFDKDQRTKNKLMRLKRMKEKQKNCQSCKKKKK